MTKTQIKGLKRIVITLILYVAVILLNKLVLQPRKLEFLSANANQIVILMSFFIVYLLSGWKVLVKAGKNIRRGKVFDENFLMSIASLGAFAIGEYSEAVAVMIFYLIGEWFEQFAVEKSRKSITQMMDICPEYANLWKDGQLTQLDPEEIAVGDMIIIKPGEKIPLDGEVVEGNSFLDTSALTGEPVPREVVVGDPVISGCVNREGTLIVRVQKEYEDSTVVKILELVENASSKKAKVENFITKFARFYTPIVVVAAVLLAIIPAVTGIMVWSDSLRSACIFLVISCPCALVISVPLSFFGGIGAASKAGILIKGSNYIEAVSKLSTIIFDKTGTLTKGDFKVVEIHPEPGMSKEELIEIAAHVESLSNHPIGRSIQEAYGKPTNLAWVENIQEIPGYGVKASYKGADVSVGNRRILEELQVKVSLSEEAFTSVYLLRNEKYLGAIYIADELKKTSKEAMEKLKAIGISRTIMLTGDKNAVAQMIGKQLKIDEIYGELLPEDKLSITEKILKTSSAKESVAFVGDGMNDAPVLARVDVGIAMGSLGSDAAIEAADVVLMDDDPRKIATVIKISRKTMWIVKENIVLALGVKLLVMIFGVIGIATMWEAVFADVGVSVLAIINAMRTMHERKK